MTSSAVASLSWVLKALSSVNPLPIHRWASTWSPSSSLAPSPVTSVSDSILPALIWLLPGHLGLVADLTADGDRVEALLGGLGGRRLVTAGGEGGAEQRGNEQERQTAQGRHVETFDSDSKYRAKP